MYGWIIYTDLEAKRNGAYIEKYMSRAKEIGVKLDLVIFDKLLFGFKGGKAFVSAGLPLPDFAINRSRSSAVAEQLEMLGVRVFNPSRETRVFNDKRLTHTSLLDLGIPMADTLFISKSSFDLSWIKDFPLVVKSACGHGGTEVFMANSSAELLSASKKIECDSILLQRPVSDLGRDMRVYVLGKKIVACALRTSKSDFRSNFCLGGSAEICSPDKKIREAVSRIAERFDFGLVGIDFIFDSGEPLLNEIEDVVGARMLYSMTEIDIAADYLDFIVERISS